MDQVQMQELYRQYFYYILAAGILIGLIFGAIPLILGIKRGKRNLGLLGFILAGLAGAFSPLIAIIISVIFIVLVLRKKEAAGTAGDQDPVL
jgi:hypothetical protein